MNKNESWSDERVKAELASLAQNEIAALSTRLQEIFAGVDRVWPDEMCNREIPPSVPFLLFSAVEGLQEYVEEALKLAQAASQYDEESVREHWRAVQRTCRRTGIEIPRGRF